MMQFIELVTTPELLITMAASIAAFATVLTIALPMLNRDRMSFRMRAMAIERDKMRASRVASLKTAAEGRGRLRQDARGFMRTFVDGLDLKSKFETEELKSKLKMAGLRGQAPLYAYVFFRLIMPPIVGLAALAYLFVFENPEEYTPFMKVVISGGAAFAGYYLPNMFIENLVQRRRQSLKDSFPDALDMLLICVQSGMSVEAAFGRVAKEVGTQSIELAEEFSLTTAELAYLPDRKLAYENLGNRSGLDAIKATTTALVQAESYGTPIGQALRVMAKENRDLRMTEAERKAAALPPKLTVPMIVFFLPVLFVVILGPAGITVMDITG
ncbi:MAG: type II secretion system F family protein [Hyphomicrobiaceae bacterium]